jgi:hypothetical protein
MVGLNIAMTFDYLNENEVETRQKVALLGMGSIARMKLSEGKWDYQTSADDLVDDIEDYLKNAVNDKERDPDDPIVPNMMSVLYGFSFIWYKDYKWAKSPLALDYAAEVVVAPCETRYFTPMDLILDSMESGRPLLKLSENSEEGNAMKRKIGTDRYADGVWKNAHKWIGEIDESNARELALKPWQYFKALEAMLPSGRRNTLLEGQFLSALGFSLAKAISLTSSWTFEYVLLEEDNFREDNGLSSIVSADHGTIIYPIAVMYHDYFSKTNLSGLYAEAIYEGRAPTNPSGSFTEWEIIE